MAQTGRLSLQLLWTEALQSVKKRLGEYYGHKGGGCGGVKGVRKRWGLESLTGFSELARKLHQPTNETQTGAEHVMQSKGNTACGGRRKKEKDRLRNDTHTHTYT